MDLTFYRDVVPSQLLRGFGPGAKLAIFPYGEGKVIIPRCGYPRIWENIRRLTG